MDSRSSVLGGTGSSNELFGCLNLDRPSQSLLQSKDSFHRVACEDLTECPSLGVLHDSSCGSQPQLINSSSLTHFFARKTRRQGNKVPLMRRPNALPAPCDSVDEEILPEVTASIPQHLWKTHHKAEPIDFGSDAMVRKPLPNNLRANILRPVTFSADDDDDDDDNDTEDVANHSEDRKSRTKGNVDNFVPVGEERLRQFYEKILREQRCRDIEKMAQEKQHPYREEEDVQLTDKESSHNDNLEKKKLEKTGVEEMMEESRPDTWADAAVQIDHPRRRGHKLRNVIFEPTIIMRDQIAREVECGHHTSLTTVGGPAQSSLKRDARESRLGCETAKLLDELRSGTTQDRNAGDPRCIDEDMPRLDSVESMVLVRAISKRSSSSGSHPSCSPTLHHALRYEQIESCCNSVRLSRSDSLNKAYECGRADSTGSSSPSVKHAASMASFDSLTFAPQPLRAVRPAPPRQQPTRVPRSKRDSEQGTLESRVLSPLSLGGRGLRRVQSSSTRSIDPLSQPPPPPPPAPSSPLMQVKHPMVAIVSTALGQKLSNAPRRSHLVGEIPDTRLTLAPLAPKVMIKEKEPLLTCIVQESGATAPIYSGCQSPPPSYVERVSCEGRYPPTFNTGGKRRLSPISSTSEVLPEEILSNTSNDSPKLHATE